MEKQMIISIGRESGSGGHRIGRELAKKFDIPLYDKNILLMIALDKSADPKMLEKYSEQPKKAFGSRTVKGHNNSPYEHVTQLEFDYLRERAQSGESFVVVGRCAEFVLAKYPGLISIFVRGDVDDKVYHIMNRDKITRQKALAYINFKDKKKKQYHDSHCPTKWGRTETYDLCINETKLGLDRTVEFLEDYIKLRGSICTEQS